MGIIGVLAAIVIVAINPSRQLAQSRNAARRRAAKEIISAVQQHVIENGSLPPGIDTTLRMIGTNTAGCAISCTDGGSPVTVLPFSVRVAASADDAEEVPAWNWTYLNSSDLELAVDSNVTHPTSITGIRFRDVTVPAEASIIDARITFTVNETTGGAATLTVSGQAINDASAFSGVGSDISTRSRTAAAVTWNPTDWSVLDSTENTPNLAPVVQEILNRPGWTSGNDIVFFISGTGTRNADSFDGEPGDAPLLSLSYTIGGDGGRGITADSCLNLNTALTPEYLVQVPEDPRLGSSAKTFYAVKRLASNRLQVQSCGAELGELIMLEQ